jgi:hypothetical protein
MARLELYYSGWAVALESTLEALQHEPSRRVRVHVIDALAQLANPKGPGGAPRCAAAD